MVSFPSSLPAGLPWASFPPPVLLPSFPVGLGDRQTGRASIGIFRAGGDFHFKGYLRPFLVSGGVVPYLRAKSRSVGLKMGSTGLL